MSLAALAEAIEDVVRYGEAGDLLDAVLDTAARTGRKRDVDATLAEWAKDTIPMNDDKETAKDLIERLDGLQEDLDAEKEAREEEKRELENQIERYQKEIRDLEDERDALTEECRALRDANDEGLPLPPRPERVPTDDDVAKIANKIVAQRLDALSEEYHTAGRKQVRTAHGKALVGLAAELSRGAAKLRTESR